MAYSIDFVMRPQFLQATVTGKNSAAAVRGYLADVRDECERRDCHRVLIIEKLEGPRLDMGSVFTVASGGAQSALGVFHAIAYVDEEMGDMAEFAENVAVNRGIPVKAFNNIAAAERWLNHLEEGAELEQDIFHGEDGPDET